MLLFLLWPRLLVAFVLGLPLLLAIWALVRLRGLSPAVGSTPAADASQASASMGLGKTYLMANYTVAVQLSNLHGEQALMIVSYLISFQMFNIYLSIQILVLWRSVPVSFGLVCLAIAAWLANRFVEPAVAKYFTQWDVAATRDQALPRQRRAWALLGYACFWGCFTFIFAIAILREYYL